jgi:hypothetical protein
MYLIEHDRGFRGGCAREIRGRNQTSSFSKHLSVVHLESGDRLNGNPAGLSVFHDEEQIATRPQHAGTG